MHDPTTPYTAGRAVAALPVKTERGVEEIRRRSRTLSQRQRTVLLLIDGRRSVSEIRHVAAQVGASDTCFDELLDLGLVSLPEPEPAPVAEPLPAAAEAVAAPEPLPQTEPPPMAEPLPEPVLAAEPDLEPEPAPEPEAEPDSLFEAEDVAMEAEARPEPPYAETPIDVADWSHGAPAFEAAPSQDTPDEALGDVVPAYGGPPSDSGVVYDTGDSDPRFAPLPRRRTTPPGWLDSVKSSLLPLFESAFGPLDADTIEPVTDDGPLEEARRILMRELREKAPVTGSLALLKVRKARTREELAALLDNVGFHIGQPSRHLSAQQVVMRVRGILDSPAGPT